MGIILIGGEEESNRVYGDVCVGKGERVKKHQDLALQNLGAFLSNSEILQKIKKIKKF